MLSLENRQEQDEPVMDVLPAAYPLYKARRRPHVTVTGRVCTRLGIAVSFVRKRPCVSLSLAVFISAAIVLSSLYTVDRLRARVRLAAYLADTQTSTYGVFSANYTALELSACQSQDPCEIMPLFTLCFCAGDIVRSDHL